jgi:hypothetical protein
MQQFIAKIVALILSLICLYFYFAIFQSSLRLEELKKSFHSKSINLKVSQTDAGTISFEKLLQNPSEKEILFRFRLIKGMGDLQIYKQLLSGYQALLTTKPTWPYYFSGLAQVDRLMNVSVIGNLSKAMKYGAHERKVIKSVAEILFTSWEKINKTDKNHILDYLSGRNDIMITSIVGISAKFAKIYEFCDYIYEKKHVEYAACKQQYWQPLTDL